MPALTGLRFILAMFVVFYHLGAEQMKSAPAWVALLAGHGDLAVSAFFILSGFVLTHSYMVNGEFRGSRRDFWIARFARIYPVYALVILFALPFRLGNADHPHGWADALASLSVIGLMQAWVPDYAMLVNSAAWSLSVEAFFYAVFPFLLPLLSRMRVKELLVSAAALWILLLSPGIVASLLGQGWDLQIYCNPLRNLPAFMLGMAAQRLFALNWFRLPFLDAGAAALIVATICMGAPRRMLASGLLAPAFTILILGLATGRGLLAKLLSQPAMVLLGDASYSIYLIHLPIIVLAKSINQNAFHLPESSWTFLAGTIGLTIAVSIGLFLFIERPYRTSIIRSLRGIQSSRACAAR